MSADNWQRIKNHLERAGYMTHEGITRKAQARGCRHCHAPVLAGLDGDVAARDIRVDPDPLTPLGEALALLAGRGTYSLRRTGGRYEFDRRDSFHIAGQPAGTRSYDVLAEHRCGSPPLPTGPSAFQPPAASHASKEPPF